MSYGQEVLFFGGIVLAHVVGRSWDRERETFVYGFVLGPKNRNNPSKRLWSTLDVLTHLLTDTPCGSKPRTLINISKINILEKRKQYRKDDYDLVKGVSRTSKILTNPIGYWAGFLSNKYAAFG